MTAAKHHFPVIREAVSSFADEAHFRDAVARLLAAGFKATDLSILATHESLATAGAIAGYAERQETLLPASLTEEFKWIGPLTVAGIIMLTGGPIAFGIAAVVGAGLGGAAVKEIFDRYTAAGHRDAFAKALHNGAVLLWVRCEDPDLEIEATRILEEAGGHFTHIHGRPVGEKPVEAEG
jgi:hypothetical protein